MGKNVTSDRLPRYDQVRVRPGDRVVATIDVRDDGDEARAQTGEVIEVSRHGAWIRWADAVNGRPSVEGLPFDSFAVAPAIAREARGRGRRRATAGGVQSLPLRIASGATGSQAKAG